jgi:hypothetical protein
MEKVPDLHSLWVGPRLSWLEQLCVKSWLAHGHRPVLWAYHPIAAVPAGVELRDARELLPERAITYHRFSGSVSLFSNRFRYHLLQRLGVTWVDMDVFLLRPLSDATPHLFGWESEDSICSAVLRLPSGSPVLRDLIALTGSRVPVPHWWPLKERVRQRLYGLVGAHEAAEDMRWGTFGPRALTETLRRHRLTGLAQPRATFYPLNWGEAALLFEPPHVVEAQLGPRTVAVHLWSSGGFTATEAMKARRHAPVPLASWIGRQCEAYGIDRGETLAHAAAAE